MMTAFTKNIGAARQGAQHLAYRTLPLACGVWYAVTLALVVALVQGVLPLVGA